MLSWMLAPVLSDGNGDHQPKLLWVDLLTSYQYLVTGTDSSQAHRA